MYPKQMNRLKRLEKLHRLKLQPMFCEAPQTELHETEKHVVFMGVYILTKLDRLSLGLMQSISLSVKKMFAAFTILSHLLSKCCM